MSMLTDDEEVDGLVLVLTSVLMEFQNRRGTHQQTALELMEAVCEVAAFTRYQCTPPHVRHLFDGVLMRHMAQADEKTRKPTSEIPSAKCQ